MISRVLGFISGLLIVAGHGFWPAFSNHMIMENIPREALLLPFIVLVLVFVLRAWVVWLRERLGSMPGSTSAMRSAARCSIGFQKPGLRGSGQAGR